jgi:zinc transporter
MSGFGFHITGGKATRVDIGQALEAGADLAWVHLSTTDDHAQTWLREHARLDEDVVDALTADETRPRCEKYEHGALLNMRGRSKEEMASSDPLASVRIWGAKGRVISVTRKPLIAVATVEGEVEAGEVLDPGDLITAFATAITEDLDPVVADLGDELDTCEEDLDADRVFELRRTVTRVRVTAIGYRRFLVPQRAALEKLAGLPGEWLGDDDRRHLAAAADRAARMAEELDAIRERAALVHETLTDLRAEQLDSRSLVIAIVAMVFLPLTFITGVYGMNVKGLPYADEPWAFDAVMGGCTLIAAGIVIYFVRRHWFSR